MVPRRRYEVKSDGGFGTDLYRVRRAMQESDLAIVSFPYNALHPYLVAQHRMLNEADKELLVGLGRAGFKLDGEGTGGLFEKYWRHGGVRLL